MRTGTTIHEPWQAVLEWLGRSLREKGFEVRRTFDLRLARQSLEGGEAGPCPHHGTALCTCQYLVFQLRRPGRSPSAVVIHGHDMTTTIAFLTGTAEEMDQDMTAAMYEALEHLQAPRAATRSLARATAERDDPAARRHRAKRKEHT